MQVTIKACHLGLMLFPFLILSFVITGVYLSYQGNKTTANVFKIHKDDTIRELCSRCITKSHDYSITSNTFYSDKHNVREGTQTLMFSEHSFSGTRTDCYPVLQQHPDLVVVPKKDSNNTTHRHCLFSCFKRRIEPDER